MKKPHSFGRSAALALAFFSISSPALFAQGEATRLVLVNGRSLPLDKVAVEGGKFVVKVAADGFAVGNSFALENASHISGEKPASIAKGVAQLLVDKPDEALKLLEPIVTTHRASATVPGNYWLEAARTAVLVYSVYNEPAKAEALGKEINEATTEPGIDPYVRLGQTLALPLTVKYDERLAKLTELISDENPVGVCAFASYFRAKLILKDQREEGRAKREEQALAAYMSIGCLYPACGLVLTSAAELNAAAIVRAKPGNPEQTEKRREEALAMLESAARGSKGTAVGTAATKAIEGLK